MKLCFGILNWNRDISPMLDDGPFKKLVDSNELIICSNKERPKDTKYHYIQADSNISRAKNSIIKKAKSLGADYLFILEDDVKVIDTSAFIKYKILMEKYNIGFVFYPYLGKNANRVINDKSNPCIIAKVNESEFVYFSRFYDSGVLGFDLNKNDLLFNEELIVLDMDEYLYRCKEKEIIPFSGFYFDIAESWKYFEKIKCEKQRIIVKEALLQDQSKMKNAGIKIKLEGNVDKLAKYLRERN